MIKAKNWRRRAEDDDGDTADENEKGGVKTVSEKSGKAGLRKEAGKEKSVSSKASTHKLLSFAGDEEDGDGMGSKKSSSAAVRAGSKKDKLKHKAAKAAGHGLLSFDAGELETEAVVVSAKSKKKAAFGTGHGSGHKLGKEKLSATPSNVQPQAGEYTKEKLLELERNTLRLGGPKSAGDSVPSEPVLVLKGLVKPVVAENGASESAARDEKKAVPGLDWGGVQEDRSGSKEELARLRLDRDDAESRLELMGIGPGADGGGITHIPDAAAIAAAKAKREKLRLAQAAPDYISLGSGETVHSRGGKLRESGLVREQDDDLDKDEAASSGDEGEPRGRMAFLAEKSSTREKKKGGVFESVDERADGSATQHRDEDEEDEERRWEEEQLRKGVGKRVDEAAVRAAAVGPSPAAHSTGFVPGSIPAPSLSTVGWGFGGRGVETLSAAQHAESTLQALREGLQRMRESHGRTKADLFRTEENLNSSILAIGSLDKALTAAGDKYVYMQELRDYVSALCDFLQDKGPLIEELEEHMQKLHEERANSITERRAADNADEMLEVDAAVTAATAAINRGAGTATAAAAAAAVAASALDGMHSGPVLDEFGRDVNLQKRLETKRRAQARERRKSRTAAKRSSWVVTANGDGASSQRIEGESSSDESESEQRAYQSGREEVLQTAERVFGDAADDFAQLAKVKQKLEGWKRQYPTAYRDAYMSLSAPAIFAHFVRLELLKWDPIYGDARFDSMQWYTQLFDYGMPPNGKEMDSADVDANLIPNLVEKVALPVLHHEVAHCWDTFSLEGTKRASAAVKEILIYVDASSAALQELLAAIRIRLASSVASIEVPFWPLNITSAVAQAGRLAAHRFGTAVRLLRNISLWKGVLAMPVLDQLALEELLSGKILPHLWSVLPTHYDAITRTERVVAALLGVWVGPNFVGELSPKLDSFKEYLMALTRAVEKKKDSAASSEDVMGLARRVKKMLVELNEYDRARRLAKTFQLKEAL